MKQSNGKQAVQSAAKKKRIEPQDDLIPSCPRCPDGIILDEIDYGDGPEWFFCPSCERMFKKVEVHWLDDSELIEGYPDGIMPAPEPRATDIILNHDTLIARATEAYLLRCHNLGLEPVQPYSDCCVVKESDGAIMVVLGHDTGALAAYQYDPKRDRLKWIAPVFLPKHTGHLRRRAEKEVDLAAWRLEDFVRYGRGVGGEDKAEIENRYPRADLGPYTDFDWGMLCGKLSALRWVQGYHWDMLDT